jgi:hypothetical protein
VICLNNEHASSANGGKAVDFQWLMGQPQKPEKREAPNKEARSLGVLPFH